MEFDYFCQKYNFTPVFTDFYGITNAILGISETRWNQNGIVNLTSGENVIYSGNPNENDHHTKELQSCYQNMPRKA